MTNKIMLPIIKEAKVLGGYHQLGLPETGSIIFGYTGSVFDYIRIYVSNQMAETIIGSQPMTDPIGQIYTLRARYKC